jgi:hypothetical protein
MSVTVVVFTVLSLSIFAGLAWLVAWPLPKEGLLSPNIRVEDLVPLHTQHFPQLKQSLQSTDRTYMRQKATRTLQREWREERRKVLRGFLDGLEEDFAKLDRLARVVASLSPRVSRGEEFARLWLTLRFRLTFRIASIWIFAAGAGQLARLSYLTALLADLSARADAGMARLQVRPL